MYIHLLITNHEIVPCNHSFKEFVVQEFSHTTLSLKVSTVHAKDNNYYNIVLISKLKVKMWTLAT